MWTLSLLEICNHCNHRYVVVLSIRSTLYMQSVYTLMTIMIDGW
jgi:hypothetical protein